MRRRPGVTTAPTTAAVAIGDRPGLTAAPTTAAFATGDRPGPTADATTAALATGAPTTPTRPTRAALNTISGSCRLECLIGLDRGDDRLDGDSAVGEELAARAPSGGRERCCPEVLVDEHPCDAARVECVPEMSDVFGRQQLSELSLELDEGTEVAGVG